MPPTVSTDSFRLSAPCSICVASYDEYERQEVREGGGFGYRESHDCRDRPVDQRAGVVAISILTVTNFVYGPYAFDINMIEEEEGWMSLVGAEEVEIMERDISKGQSIVKSAKRAISGESSATLLI